MDKDRQIRFLYPPLFLVGFWLLAVKLDPARPLSAFLPNFVVEGDITIGDLAAILAGGGVVVLVAGFMIGVVSVVVLRWGFRAFRKPTYEIGWSHTGLASVRKEFGIAEERDGDGFYLAAAYDHLRLPKEIQMWRFRRWSSFNLTCHSCVAMVIAWAACWWTHIYPTFDWYLIWCLCFAFLVFQAIYSWRETMGMAEFYLRLSPDFLRPLPKAAAANKKSEDDGPEPE